MGALFMAVSLIYPNNAGGQVGVEVGVDERFVDPYPPETEPEQGLKYFKASIRRDGADVRRVSPQVGAVGLPIAPLIMCGASVA